MDERLKFVARLLDGEKIGGEALKPAAEHRLENRDAVIATNLTGVWPCMKHEIPALLRSGGGAIVNNSSGYGLAGTAIGNVPYVAAKHGVIGLNKSAAIEYAVQGIRVNAVRPRSLVVDGGQRAR